MIFKSKPQSKTSKIITIILIVSTIIIYSVFIINKSHSKDNQTINNDNVNGNDVINSNNESIIDNNVIEEDINDYKDSSNEKVSFLGSINNNSIYESKILNIKADLKGYTILSREEIIQKYHLDDDFYKEDNIRKLINKGNSYYDLIANDATNDVSLSLSISGGYYTNKSILNQYSDKKIESMIKSYENKGYKDILVSIDLMGIFNDFDNKTPVLSSSYTDLDNNHIYQYVVYIVNKQYLGSLNIVSINNDCFDEFIKLFEISNID